MTVEEIKNTYSMREIVEKYGIEINRSGFCKCPFHNEKTASMKIYAQSYYCFGCHAGGDVLEFVQAMEGVDFKTAYKSLGGTYDGDRGSYSTRYMTYKAKAKAEQVKRDKERRRQKRQELNQEINSIRSSIEGLEPFSDEWCAMTDRLQKAMVEAGLYGEGGDAE